MDDEFIRSIFELIYSNRFSCPFQMTIIASTIAAPAENDGKYSPRKYKQDSGMLILSVNVSSLHTRLECKKKHKTKFKFGPAIFAGISIFILYNHECMNHYQKKKRFRTILHSLHLHTFHFILSIYFIFIFPYEIGHFVVVLKNSKIEKNPRNIHHWLMRKNAVIKFFVHPFRSWMTR